MKASASALFWRASRTTSSSPKRSTARRASRPSIPHGTDHDDLVGPRGASRAPRRAKRHDGRRRRANPSARPPEVYAGTDRQVEGADGAQREGRSASGARRRAFTGTATASSVQGWLLYPLAFDASQALPDGRRGPRRPVVGCRASAGPHAGPRSFPRRATSSFSPIPAAATDSARRSRPATSRTSAAAICATC